MTVIRLKDFPTGTALAKTVGVTSSDVAAGRANADFMTDLLATAGVPAAIGAEVTFLPAGTGAQARTYQGKFRESISVKDFQAVGDGVVYDDAAINNAVEAANGAEVYIPVGTYLLADSIKRLTSVSDDYRAGMRLKGAGDQTVLKIDTNNKPAILFDVGYPPTGTTTGTLKFTRGSSIEQLKIIQSAGKTGCDGIKLTAAWNVDINDVTVYAMSGDGIIVPFRSDIYAAISDYWQCFSIRIAQSKFSECTGWGVNFAGGQSPGLWSIEHSTIANNAGGGVYCSQGQFNLVDNLIVGNGTHGASNGGMLIDVVEGPQFMAYIARNEFDTNYNYHINGYRLTSSVVELNRFLSNTYDATTGGNIVSTGGYMRPAYHVSIGSGSPAGYYPINSRFARNFHRSPPTSSVTVNCYATGGDMYGNTFEDNQMSASENSAGLSIYSGTALTNGLNRVIHDGAALAGQPYFAAYASAATSIPDTSTPTPVVFGTLVTSGGGYNSSLNLSTGVFTAPTAGLYSFTATVGFDGTVTTGRVGFRVNGGTINVGVCGTSGSSNTPILSSNKTVYLAKNDTVEVVALQAGSGSLNTLAGVQYSEFSGYRIPTA